MKNLHSILFIALLSVVIEAQALPSHPFTSANFGFTVEILSCNGITIDPDIAPDPFDPNPFSVDWGDGQVTFCDGTNCQHDYLLSGTYTVCVTALFLPDGEPNTSCQEVTLDTNCACASAPVFDLTVAGCDVLVSVPLPFPWPVNPDDAWPIFSVYWGDGTSEVVVNEMAAHTYSYGGIFDVTVQVQCPGNGSLAEATQTVDLAGSCGGTCALPTGINYFVDDLTLNITSFDIPLPNYNPNLPLEGYEFYWAFGDGTFSTESMPSHTFPNPGIFTTCWTVTCTNTGQQVQLYETLSVGDGCCPLPVNINFDINGLVVTATSIEIPGYEGMDWDDYTFLYSWGDGFFSSDPLPSHEYPEGGTFSGCVLVACDVCGARWYMYPSFSVTPNECVLPVDIGVAVSDDPVPTAALYIKENVLDPLDSQSLCNQLDLSWSFNGMEFSNQCVATRLMEEEGIWFFSLVATCAASGETVQIDKTIFPAPPACPGDLDNNGQVNTADLLSLLAAYGNTCGPPSN